MIIEKYELKTEVLSEHNNIYAGGFFTYIPELEKDIVISFFTFENVNDRLENHSGVFSKFDCDLKSQYIIYFHMPKKLRTDTPFMPYSIFKWMDEKLSGKWNVVPVLDIEEYSRYMSKTISYYIKGFNLILESKMDYTKCKLLSE